MNIQPTVYEASRSKEKGTIRKLENYYEEYGFHFAPIREQFKKSGDTINILEIGIQGGGSLYMWKKYFPLTQVTGVDIDPECLQYADKQSINIEIGDQADARFLQEIENKHGPFDIIIDDGGHTMKQQLTSFKVLFPLLKDGGVYVIEDIHTSYWHEFGGRLGKRKTAVGLLKKLIDDMHYWAIRHPRATILSRARRKLYILMGWKLPVNLSKNIYQEYIKSIHIADSIVFIYKGKIKKHKTERI